MAYFVMSRLCFAEGFAILRRVVFVLPRVEFVLICYELSLFCGRFVSCYRGFGCFAVSRQCFAVVEFVPQ